jgi:virginiamycin B lyase
LREWWGSAVRRFHAVVLIAALAAAIADGGVARAMGQTTFERFYAGGASDPGPLVSGPDGALWFTWEKGVGRLALDGTVRLHRIAGVGYLSDLTAGRDGALWLADVQRHQVGRFTLDGKVSLLAVQDGTQQGLAAIATGSDGALWIANSDAGRIERLEPDGVARFAADVTGGVTGPDRPSPRAILPVDGDVWFAAVNLGIGRLGVGGEIQIVDRTFELGLSESLAAGPDGSVWAASFLSDQIVHLNADGVLGRARASTTGAVVVAEDGTPWFGHSRGLLRLGARSLRRQLFRDPFGRTSDCGRDESQLAFPAGMAFSRDGALWASDSGHGSFLRVGPPRRARSLLHPVLASRAARHPHDLVVGRDGVLWVAGDRTVIAVPPRGRPRVYSVEGDVGALAIGPTGRPWVSIGASRAGHARFAEITPGGKVRTVASLPRSSLITAMARDDAGTIWFADYAGRRIGRLSREGGVSYVTGPFERRARLRDVAVSADGALWVTDRSGAILRIGRDRVVRRFRLSGRAGPRGIVEGPDHAMWFTDFSRRRVGRITRDGAVRETRLTDRPLAIAAGTDGALWVTTFGGTGDNGLVRVTTHGNSRRFFVRQACQGAVNGLLSTPEGALLFTIADGPVAVGRLDLHQLARTGQFSDPD